jgi:hypothetical protein
MPAFVNSAFQSAQLLQKGVPAYLIGSFSQQLGNTKIVLATDAISSNLATITGQPLGGPLPQSGDLISIAASSNGSSVFNVNRVAISSASYVASTNVITVTFPLTSANQAATSDSGAVIVEPGEVGESVTSAGFTSVAVVVQAPEGDSQFTIPFSCTGGASITAMSATLQRAIKVQSNEWTNTSTVVTKTGASTYTAGPVVLATLERGYVYRVAVTGVTGSDKVVAKIG